MPSRHQAYAMKQLLLGIFILSISYTVDTIRYPHRVGYIPKEKAINVNPDFQLCDESIVVDYYNVNGPDDHAAGYIGGPKAIKRLIHSDYPELNLKDESGMLTIRFIINCNGEIGRFEIIENDLDFQPKKFDEEVKSQLFEITQKLENWRPNHLKGQNRDCAMYLTYKIKNGVLTDILP